jgi:hypothetical protein
MLKKMCLMVFALMFVAPRLSHAAKYPPQNVLNCSQATKAKQGVGNAFQGDVTNDDYAFSARVPSGFTGWSGVAEGAPFHGFTIFLDSKSMSCIVVEMHIRIDDDEAPNHPSSAVVQLGSSHGMQLTSRGEVAGAPFTNITTSFSATRGGEVDDGEVLLIAPTPEIAHMKRVYDAFLRSIKFGK